MRTKYLVVSVTPLTSTVEFKRIDNGKTYYMYWPSWRDFKIGAVVELTKLTKEN